MHRPLRRLTIAGNPVRPTTAPSGSGSYAGPQTVSYGSVLGQLTAAAKAQIDADPINCSQYTVGIGNTGVVANSNWDKYRKTYDTTGFVDRFSKMMPLPNYYRSGDGLNTAALRWTRTTHGEDTVYGSGMDSARKSITAKIDHNLSAKHRLSGTYSFEKDLSDGENEPTWPTSSNGFGGAIFRQPQTVTATFTSTLKPTLLNEFRFGLAYNMNQTMGPMDNPTTAEALKSEMQKYVNTSGWTDWKGLPVLVAPADGFTPSASNFYGGRTSPASTWGGRDWRWSYSDTISWTKGAHAFKFGGDVRTTKTQSFLSGSFDATFNSTNWFPYVTGGDSQYATPTGLLAGGGFPGIVGTDNVGYSAASGSVSSAYSLLNYMVGSVASVKQHYFAKDTAATAWSDPTTPEGQLRWVRTGQREFDVFFKDDWKVSNNLTLNLGVRWEYYGVPWNLDGMTVGVVGGAQNLFGGQSGGFGQWLRGTPAFDSTKLTTQHMIGPDSANPGESLFNKDMNNFGPAVGFAWELPWLGKGKTTIRGGYQLSYLQITRAWDASATQPGTQWRDTFSGDSQKLPYMDLATLSSMIPTSKWWDGSVKPLAIRPLNGKQDADASVWDPNVRSPYIQSLTMAITRQVGSSLTVDVRYIGTLSRKQMGTVNLNTNNWLKNGLKEAFDTARAGGESALLDQLLPSGSLGYVQGSGATQLRTSAGPYGTSTSLAQGNYNAVASVLATTNGTYYLPNGYGEAVRRSGLGANFIKTNTQFQAANWNANLNNSQYHSLQAQVTLRPTHGFNFQATYTWSRNLGIRGEGTDPLNRHDDYGILSSNRAHSLTTYGTFTLPLGSSGFAFRNSKGWVKEFVEGWQLSWVSSMSSGTPFGVTNGSVYTMMAGSMIDLVDPSLFDTKAHVTWEPGARGGFYWGDAQYKIVDDPSCSAIAAGLQTACKMGIKALAVASGPNAGKIVFQQAPPGRRGNFDANSLVGPGRWSLDAAISKNFKIAESKAINFRIDVNNIFNHPTPSGTTPFSYDQRTYAPGNPIASLVDTTVGTNSFGYIGYKVGHRVFSAKVRLTF